MHIKGFSRYHPKITWPKKLRKKKQAWDKACIDYGLIKA
jgi:hypothetical protein